MFAEDVDRCLGVFNSLCPPGAFHAGVRGLAPGADLEGEIAEVLRALAEVTGAPPRLVSAIEEQGLQTAAMCRLGPMFLVRKDEVSICSPFSPRSPEFGTCGAHCVGMNARHTPWDYYDLPGGPVA